MAVQFNVPSGSSVGMSLKPVKPLKNSSKIVQFAWGHPVHRYVDDTALTLAQLKFPKDKWAQSFSSKLSADEREEIHAANTRLDSHKQLEEEQYHRDSRHFFHSEQLMKKGERILKKAKTADDRYTNMWLGVGNLPKGQGGVIQAFDPKFYESVRDQWLLSGRSPQEEIQSIQTGFGAEKQNLFRAITTSYCTVVEGFIRWLYAIQQGHQLSSDDRKKLTSSIAELSHFVTDSTMPLHTTRFYNWWPFGNQQVVNGDYSETKKYRMHQLIEDTGSALMTKRDQQSIERLVTPILKGLQAQYGELEPENSVALTAISALRESYLKIFELVALQRILMNEFGIDEAIPEGKIKRYTVEESGTPENNFLTKLKLAITNHATVSFYKKNAFAETLPPSLKETLFDYGKQAIVPQQIATAIALLAFYLQQAFKQAQQFIELEQRPPKQLPLWGMAETV